MPEQIYNHEYIKYHKFKFMKQFFTLILIVVVIGGCSQNNEKNNNSDEISQIQNELNNMIKAQSNIELKHVDPESVDQFIESIKENDMDKIWDLTDDKIKKLQSKDDITKLINLYRSFYGQIRSYKQSTFNTSVKPGFGQFVNVLYNVEFVKYKGKASGGFKVYDDNNTKMFSFNMSLNDYEKVNKIDVIAQPVIEAIKAKNRKKIYAMTTNKYKEYTSASAFEAKVEKIIGLDLKDCKMFRQQLSVLKGNATLVVYYEINDKSGYLSLSFAQQDDVFVLDGFRHITN